MIAPPPLIVRVASADAIVVGTVVGLEDQDRQVLPYSFSKSKVSYRIAIVRVNESLHGALVKKTIRVGFFAPPSRLPAGRGVEVSSRGYLANHFKVGARGVYFLKKHFKQPFFVSRNYFDFINSSNNKAFSGQLGQLRKLVKVANEPVAGLKSKDSEKRLLAAAYLITKYRTPPQTRPLQTEPIGANESKLILSTLAEVNWKPQVSKYGGMPLTPQYIFAQLGIGKKDGFQAPRSPRTPNAYQNAARAWLRQHAGTYRILRYVEPKK